MIPLGWNPRKYTPYKYKHCDKKVIWYIMDNNRYVPHDMNTVLSWDDKYISNHDKIYNTREKRKYYAGNYYKIAKSFSKINPDILNGD